MKNFKILKNICTLLMIINLIMFLLKIIDLELAKANFFLFSGIYALTGGLILLKQKKKGEGLVGILSLYIFIYVVCTLIFNNYK